MMDRDFHYAPEVLELLVDTIGRLNKGRPSLLTFFKGAGVDPSLYADITRAIALDPKHSNKFEITRKILTRLNERHDAALRERREIVKRVVEFEDFSCCWPADRLEAEGLVARVRHVVNVKDSFVRIDEERERERIARVTPDRMKLELIAVRKKDREYLKRDFYALFGMDDRPYERADLLEKILNRLFEHERIKVEEDFKRRSVVTGTVLEQIDGVIYLDGHLYLVEMKWHKTKVDPAEISHHLSRIMYREARAIFITASSFTEAGIEACRDAMTQRSVVAVLTTQLFVDYFESDGDLAPMLIAKIKEVILERHPLGRVRNAS